jgi:hypothetical protein
MINVFPSEHSTSLETSNSCLHVVIPLLYIVLHYSVAPLQHFQPPTFASGYELLPRNFTQTSTTRSISAVLNRPIYLHDHQDSLHSLVKAEVQPFRNSLLSDLYCHLCTDPFDRTHARRTIHPGLDINIIIFGSRFMGSEVEDLLIHPRINFNHRGLSNIWYNHHQHPPSTSCKVSLHLSKCPKAGIAAPQVVRAFFCHTARLPQSRGQLARHPQALIGESTSFIRCTNADNTSLRIVRASICFVSRHIEAVPHS